MKSQGRTFFVEIVKFNAEIYQLSFFSDQGP